MQRTLSVLPRPLTTHEIPFIHQMAFHSHPEAQGEPTGPKSCDSKTCSFEDDVWVPRRYFFRKTSAWFVNQLPILTYIVRDP